MAKKKVKNETMPEQVNEPMASYGKRLTLSSLEVLDEKTLQHTLIMTPEQHMEYLQQLIYNIYGDDFSKQIGIHEKGRLTIRKELIS